jgi:hypothetical protein
VFSVGGKSDELGDIGDIVRRGDDGTPALHELGSEHRLGSRTGEYDDGTSRNVTDGQGLSRASTERIGIDVDGEHSAHFRLQLTNDASPDGTDTDDGDRGHRSIGWPASNVFGVAGIVVGHHGWLRV